MKADRDKSRLVGGRKRDGNAIQIQDFFESYYRMFVSFAYNYVRDRVVCEDQVQEAFISYLELDAEHFDENEAKKFLYKAIRNRCLNHLRHEGVMSRYSLNQQEEYDRTKASDEFFIDSIMQEESSRIVINAIDKLPEMGRQVIELSVEGLSNDEIAERLRISVNTVRTHKARTYKMLRITLANLK